MTYYLVHRIAGEWLPCTYDGATVTIHESYHDALQYTTLSQVMTACDKANDRFGYLGLFGWKEN